MNFNKQVLNVHFQLRSVNNDILLCTVCNGGVWLACLAPTAALPQISHCCRSVSNEPTLHGRWEAAAPAVLLISDATCWCRSQSKSVGAITPTVDPTSAADPAEVSVRYQGPLHLMLCSLAPDKQAASCLPAVAAVGGLHRTLPGQCHRRALSGF